MGRFDYRAELRRAHAALHRKVEAYILAHKEKSVRALAKDLNMSVGVMLTIARRCRKRKPGRPYGRRITFNVRYSPGGKMRTVQVTVRTADKTVTNGDMREWVKWFYSAIRVSVARCIDDKCKQHEYDKHWESEKVSKSLTVRQIRGTSGIDTAIRTLAACEQTGEVTEKGRWAHTCVRRFIREHRQSKDWKRAVRAEAKYSELLASDS